MKKLLFVAILAAVAVYGLGRFSFSESGINRFLGAYEQMLHSGDADGICKTFTDDMQYKIKDHTANLFPGGKVDRAGGRQTMCDEASAQAVAMSRIQWSDTVVRHDMRIEWSWLHPWTAQVSYTEFRTTVLGGKLTFKTESDDRMVLIRTLTGVKIKSLESEAFMQE